MDYRTIILDSIIFHEIVIEIGMELFGGGVPGTQPEFFILLG